MIPVQWQKKQEKNRDYIIPPEITNAAVTALSEDELEKHQRAQKNDSNKWKSPTLSTQIT